MKAEKASIGFDSVKLLNCYSTDSFMFFFNHKKQDVEALNATADQVLLPFYDGATSTNSD